MSRLSELPSVEQLLQQDDIVNLIRTHGRPLTVDAVRRALEDMRGRMRTDPEQAAPDVRALVSMAATRLDEWERPSLQPVINATGVILHTNLGRAPLSVATIAAMQQAAASYTNLEFDLATGKRGTRLAHAETLLQRLLRAEAALVVNNNASAVLLVLSALAARKNVVIARSQLVEIGGGFRVPDVMRQSGARLVEVGTTNKVRIADYEQPLAEPGSVAMWVHRSNFRIVGFTEEPELRELADAAHAAGRLLIDDNGSGALLDTARYGLAHEPTVQEALAAGADIVCFSGDKLLGGPQAGIIVGRQELIQKIRRHPLARAMRADKTSVAGVAATLLHYLRDEAEREIPTWRMIAEPAAEIGERAAEWAAQLGAGSVQESESTVGGGSLPGETLPTHVLALDVRNADRFLKRLRRCDTPIIARTQDGKVLLDPRTVLLEQEPAFLLGLRSVLE